jgi:hypothetical protein
MRLAPGAVPGPSGAGCYHPPALRRLPMDDPSPLPPFTPVAFPRMDRARA